MRIKLLFIVIFLAVSQGSQGQAYWDPHLSTDHRVADLLQRMTREEKVGQLSKITGWEMYDKNQDGRVSISPKFKDAVSNTQVGMLWATLRADPWTQKSLKNGLSPQEAAKMVNMLQQYVRDSTRLGIPLLLAEEVPHGHMAIGATVFPTAVGQASTWNPELIEQMASVIAKETFAVGGRNGYGPVLDLARDPRWSRTEETYGEDRYLVAQMGKAMVGGLQGEALGGQDRILSTLKHFVAYGVSEGGHNGGSVSIGERTLRQHYLLPFQKSIEAGAGSIMTAYNSIDGIPCTSNSWLLQNVLRKEWSYKGFVVSDLLSISGLQGSHGVARSSQEAAIQSFAAGVDVDLSGSGYGGHLIDALDAGFITEQQLNEAVRRVLHVKFSLGLFENPYVSEDSVALKVGTAEHRGMARAVARESLTLLKNQDDVLPLSKSLERIAVIGPNADNVYNQLGDYTAPQPAGKVQTVLDGVKEKINAATHIDYVQGCSIRDNTTTNIAAAVEAARQAEAVVVVLGGSSARDFKTSYEDTGAARVNDNSAKISDMESGEGFDRATLDLMGDQLKLLQAVVEVGKPTVLVLIKGRPLLLNWAADHVPAILDAWYPGEQGGMAIADVLFGDYNPAGRLPLSVPRSVGQLPVYYNQDKPVRHSYVDELDGPLFPFGYGLSYSRFDYADFSIDTIQYRPEPTIKIRFSIKNEGPFDGEEVPQVYVRDQTSSVITPIQQLIGFKRLSLENGEKTMVEFELQAKDLAIWGAEQNWIVEKGDFQLLIGSSSQDIRLKGSLHIPQDIRFGPGEN